jgi:hypothetical protein
VELAAWREVDTELEELRSLATRLQDMVMDNVGEPSSLAASLSTMVELLRDWIDTEVTSGVNCETQSALVAALSHLPELNSELELLVPGRNVDLMDD